MVLRTDESRFGSLPDFPYEPAYESVDGLRMAYVESGPSDGPVALLLHGEPSWSFLYRKVMPVLAEAGIRSVAPDLVGFGRSDKPPAAAHTYAAHVEWTRALVFDALDLTDVTVVGQDWGGLIGLRLAAEHPERVARIVAANTGLPTGEHGMPAVWWEFRRAVEKAEVLDIGRFVQSGCRTRLPDEVRAAYDAPFPTEEHKAGPRTMPGLVPVSLEDPAAPANLAAWQVLRQWQKPFLCAFSDSDPITGPMAPILRKHIPGAAGSTHPTIENAGHFLQEDAGGRLGEEIATFMRA
ncbi:haloalkane dehalogenase [Actinophytocola oryzae]|uniref:Haloalkane dehalogenase n=1 Tax=Actinophytocola oryzae TaxID=502181 RepID=A0A4R7VBA8_9PSEU|nr:haloalkane dehalogenase [Actinophytocola oryzae]TDV46316.1 haloalkane dehalogenase [Actinophytocola oryzae]